MKEVKAFIPRDKAEDVIQALLKIKGIPSIATSEARGFIPRGDAYEHTERIKLEMIVPVALAEEAMRTIYEHAHTGQPGDGRIFLSPVEATVRISTGEWTHGDV